MASKPVFVPCQIAHFRDFTSSNQCELSFHLNVAKPKIGLIYETINATRQRTDTVGSLLQHIINKIHNILKTKKNIDETFEITTLIRRSPKQKGIHDSTVLHNLVEHPEGLQFVIFEEIYTILVNVPVIKELKLPPIMYANNIVQPCKFHTIFTTKELCIFKWYSLSHEGEWIQIGDGFKQNLTDNEVGHFLKFSCVPSNEVKCGEQVEVFSESKVGTIGKLPLCPFHARHKLTMNKLAGNKIRVVTYNVLSSRYTNTLSYCPADVLAIDYRKLLISEELLGYNADIICLQEVDSHVFTSYYKSKFKDPYTSYYCKKGNRIPEGLLCIFDKTKFKKVDSELLIFSEEIQKNRLFANLWNLLTMKKELKELFLKQATSLQVNVLKIRQEQHKHIIVANTHFFYHPEAEPVRIIQSAMALTYLSWLRNQYFNKKKSNVVVIFCGDFNANPRSAVYDFLIKGQLDNNSPSAKRISRKCDLSHDFNLKSACGTPKYTNYTEDFKDCLDYIFVCDKIKIDRVIPLPNEKELEEQGALPNRVYPSDHLSLIADLEIF